MTSLPALLDDLQSNCLDARKALQTWLTQESDVKNIATLAKQLSAAQDSLKKCRDGETITLALQNEYASAKLRCQRRGGELLKAMEKNKGRPKANHDDELSTYQQQLGTDTPTQARSVASRWQKIADVSDEDFEELVNVEKQTEADEEITAASVLRKSNAVHVSQNTGVPEWYTPAEYIESARKVMRSIDLDPASSKQAQKTVKAGEYLTIDDDGLLYDWSGNIWLNPPYASGVVDQFMLRIKEYFLDGSITSAITLTNNCTETAWFQSCCESATAICLVAKRIKFLDESGDPVGAPLQGQAFLYFGNARKRFLSEFERHGSVWQR